MIIFAVVGLVLAAAMAGLYLYRRPSAVEPATRGAPDSAVQEFLGAVFLGGDAARVRAVVCGSWDPANAISRTTSMVDPRARVSWDDVRVVSADARRANVTARLGLRLPDDVQPSVYQQWRFTVVVEDGWRVCEARPFE